MGIVEEKIIDIELPSGQRVLIELNQSGMIHIHIDNTRIELTKEEFEKFKTMVDESSKKLNEYK